LSAVSGVDDFSAAGVCGGAAGASAGRGFGNGTTIARTVLRNLGGPFPNRSPQIPAADFRAA
jgi:hypothetical protein